MKRREFLQSVVSAPAGVALLEGSANATLVPPAADAAQAPQPAAPGAGQSGVLDTVGPDQVATIAPRFLSAAQFATLRRLSDLLFPALPPNPGALDCQAAAFLDNHLAISAADRQRLYREGLDGLHKAAQTRFKKAFADLSVSDADAIVKPLFAVRGPTMSVVELGPFINRVLQDVRTVTINSPQWAAAQNAAGTPVVRLLYWRNVDPTVPRQGFAPWTTRF